MESKGETRKILKVFGVAVTDFEDESERLLARIEAGSDVSPAGAVAALRDALELLREVNQKWYATTEHLVGLQQSFLDRAIAALPGYEKS